LSIRKYFFIALILIYSQEFINGRNISTIFTKNLSYNKPFCTIPGYNSLPDTLKICGDSTILNAGTGYSTYLWNTGLAFQNITVKQSGLYSVTVTNATGCTANDNCYISLINANIVQTDTIICPGSLVKLNIDTAWATIATIPFPRHSHGSVIYNNKVYIVGGHNHVLSVYPPQVDIYDISTNTWSIGANLPTPRGELVVSEVNGKIYAIGGYDFAATNLVHEYNPATNTWIAKASMPTSRSVMSGAVYNGKIYVAGGWPGAKDILEIYDPATNLWSTGANMPQGRKNGNSMVELNGKLYFIGGQDASGSITYNDVFVYNPILNTWTTAAPLPANRFMGVAYTDGVKIYYCGGTSNSTGSLSAQRTIFIYDPVINRWTTSSTQLPKARTRHSGNFYNGKLFVFGGIDANNNIISESILTNNINEKILWSTGDTTVSILVSPTQTTNYYVTVTDGVNSCMDSIKISVLQKPIVNFDFNGLCSLAPTVFTNQSNTSNSGAANYSWNFGDGITSNQINPTHSYQLANTYTVKLKVAPIICPNLADSISKLIIIQTSPINIRYSTLTGNPNQPLQLQARTIGSNYTWMPGNGLNNPGIINPVATLGNQQEYLVRILTSTGCIVTDTVLVQVFKSFNIFVPTAFTPNKDGLNDFLKPIMFGIKELKYFRIFNRWGEIVFEIKGVNNIQGWNGKINGKNQASANFVWIAEAITEGNQLLKLKGSFILIK
jgi:gliding motility-associated-like protein